MLLYRGDCLEIMPVLPDGSVDAIVADLPYGSTQCEWDRRIDLARFWPQARRLISPGSAVVMFADMRYGAELIASNPKWFRYDLVWDKVAPVGFLDANRRPLRSHELILVFGPKLPRYRPQKWDSGEPYSCKRSSAHTGLYGKYAESHSTNADGHRFPLSIHRSSNATGRHRTKGHPTRKPVELMSYLIRTFTDPGQTVLDPTMGSGSTGEACASTGRGFIGMEKRPDFFKLARLRIRKAERTAAA